MYVQKEKIEDFFDTFVEWSKQRNFPKESIVIPMEFLPDYVYVCYHEEYHIPMYSCCMYNTDSGVCWIGWPLGNKEFPKELRKGGLEFLFNRMAIEAKNMGYSFMFTTSNTPNVEEALMGDNYNKLDETVNHYIKKL